MAYQKKQNKGGFTFEEINENTLKKYKPKKREKGVKHMTIDQEIGLKPDIIPENLFMVLTHCRREFAFNLNRLKLVIKRSSKKHMSAAEINLAFLQRIKKQVNYIKLWTIYFKEYFLEEKRRKIASDARQWQKNMIFKLTSTEEKSGPLKMNKALLDNQEVDKYLREGNMFGKLVAFFIPNYKCSKNRDPDDLFPCLNFNFHFAEYFYYLANGLMYMGIAYETLKKNFIANKSFWYATNMIDQINTDSTTNPEIMRVSVKVYIVIARWILFSDTPRALEYLNKALKINQNLYSFLENEITPQYYTHSIDHKLEDSRVMFIIIFVNFTLAYQYQDRLGEMFESLDMAKMFAECFFESRDNIYGFVVDLYRFCTHVFADLYFEKVEFFKILWMKYKDVADNRSQKNLPVVNRGFEVWETTVLNLHMGDFYAQYGKNFQKYADASIIPVKTNKENDYFIIPEKNTEIEANFDNLEYQDNDQYNPSDHRAGKFNSKRRTQNMLHLKKVNNASGSSNISLNSSINKSKGNQNNQDQMIYNVLSPNNDFDETEKNFQKSNMSYTVRSPLESGNRLEDYSNAKYQNLKISSFDTTKNTICNQTNVSNLSTNKFSEKTNIKSARFSYNKPSISETTNYEPTSAKDENTILTNFNVSTINQNNIDKLQENSELTDLKDDKNNNHPEGISLIENDTKKVNYDRLQNQPAHNYTKSEIVSQNSKPNTFRSVHLQDRSDYRNDYISINDQAKLQPDKSLLMKRNSSDSKPELITNIDQIKRLLRIEKSEFRKRVFSSKKKKQSEEFMNSVFEDKFFKNKDKRDSFQETARDFAQNITNEYKPKHPKMNIQMGFHKRAASMGCTAKNVNNKKIAHKIDSVHLSVLNNMDDFLKEPLTNKVCKTSDCHKAKNIVSYHEHAQGMKFFFDDIIQGQQEDDVNNYNYEEMKQFNFVNNSENTKSSNNLTNVFSNNSQQKSNAGVRSNFIKSQSVKNLYPENKPTIISNLHVVENQIPNNKNVFDVSSMKFDSKLEANCNTSNKNLNEKSKNKFSRWLSIEDQKVMDRSDNNSVLIRRKILNAKDRQTLLDPPINKIFKDPFAVIKYKEAKVSYENMLDSAKIEENMKPTYNAIPCQHTAQSTVLERGPSLQDMVLKHEDIFKLKKWLYEQRKKQHQRDLDIKNDEEIVIQENSEDHMGFLNRKTFAKSEIPENYNITNSSISNQKVDKNLFLSARKNTLISNARITSRTTSSKNVKSASANRMTLTKSIYQTTNKTDSTIKFEEKTNTNKTESNLKKNPFQLSKELIQNEMEKIEAKLLQKTKPSDLLNKPRLSMTVRSNRFLKKPKYQPMIDSNFDLCKSLKGFKNGSSGKQNFTDVTKLQKLKQNGKMKDLAEKFNKNNNQVDYKNTEGDHKTNYLRKHTFKIKDAMAPFRHLFETQKNNEILGNSFVEN